MFEQSNLALPRVSGYFHQESVKEQERAEVMLQYLSRRGGKYCSKNIQVIHPVNLYSFWNDVSISQNSTHKNHKTHTEHAKHHTHLSKLYQGVLLLLEVERHKMGGKCFWFKSHFLHLHTFRDYADTKHRK